MEVNVSWTQSFCFARWRKFRRSVAQQCACTRHRWPARLKTGKVTDSMWYGFCLLESQLKIQREKDPPILELVTMFVKHHLVSCISYKTVTKCENQRWLLSSLSVQVRDTDLELSLADFLRCIVLKSHKTPHKHLLVKLNNSILLCLPPRLLLSQQFFPPSNASLNTKLCWILCSIVLETTPRGRIMILAISWTSNTL